MNKTIFLKIIREISLINALGFLFILLIMTVSQDQTFWLRRPFGEVIYMLAISRYTSYKGWKKWALAVLPPLVFGFIWFSLTQGFYLGPTQVILCSLAWAGLGGICHYLLKTS